MRYVLTNPIWQELESRVESAKRSPAGTKPELPDRLFLEAILYRARTGTPWRDLPDVFGDWNAVYQRCKRWRLAGVWDRLFDTLPTDDATAEVRRLFVDSTTIRVHPHAAGAKKKTPRPKTLSAGHAAGTRPRSTLPAPTRTPPSPSS